MRPAMRRAGWLIPLLAVVLTAGPAAAIDSVGDVEVSVLPPPSLDTRSGVATGTLHGYVEIRVQLRNTATNDRTVRLAYPVARSGWELMGTLATRTIGVPAKQQVLVSLYQPPGEGGSDILEVRVDGARDPLNLSVISPQRRPSYGATSTKASVLLGRSVPQEFRDGMRPPAAAKPSPSGGSASGTPAFPGQEFSYLRSELPVSQWSPNWLGYSCFDAIVLGSTEAESLPPEVQLALRRYIECGGTLMVHGPRAPRVLTEGGRTDGHGRHLVGLGTVIPTLAEEKDWKATYNRLSAQPIGFIPAPPNTTESFFVAGPPVPVRGLFLVVLLFAVGIGPVNLWLLNRYRKRIWLWWNVPLISLLACLAVFGYSLAAEGWSARAKICSFTWLDQRTHRAATTGYLSYYCPLTPSVGPRFNADTEVTLLVPQPTSWRSRPSESRVVDWSVGQHLASGWIKARVPAHFYVRKNEDRRERLTFTKTRAGARSVVNALGAEIRTLYVVDAAGSVFEATGIPAGAERPLAPSSLRLSQGGPPDHYQSLFLSGGWLEGFAAESRHAAEALAPGTYIAYLQRSPFLERPLPVADSQEAGAVVYGILSGDGDGR